MSYASASTSRQTTHPCQESRQFSDKLALYSQMNGAKTYGGDSSVLILILGELPLGLSAYNGTVAWSVVEDEIPSASVDDY